MKATASNIMTHSAYVGRTSKIIDRTKNHRDRVAIMLNGDLYKHSKHPIYNFLFTYLQFKPSILFKYSPGIMIEDPVGNIIASPFSHDDISSELSELEREGKVILPREVLFNPSHIISMRNNLAILKGTLSRKPFYGCFGLHEWAMLYKPSSHEHFKQHQQLPLRVNRDVLEHLIESKPLRCSHYDAYRFFSDNSRPLNVSQQPLSRSTQHVNEQPGCIHANMDIFKWALKIFPYISSDLLIDCLELAIEARIVDMRASPYDLTAYQLPDEYQHIISFDATPIPIETAEGRKEYQQHQDRMYKLASPLRHAVVLHYEDLLRCIDQQHE